jgi:hypothetical protein
VRGGRMSRRWTEAPRTAPTIGATR